jgi:hypothetical protein
LLARRSLRHPRDAPLGVRPECVDLLEDRLHLVQPPGSGVEQGRSLPTVS